MTLPFLKSAPGDDPVVIEKHFKTTAERLFRAWTAPDEIVKWFGPGDSCLETAKIDLRKGGLWEFAFPDSGESCNLLRGEYVEVTPHSSLIFTWEHQRTQPDGTSETTSPSLVSLSFKEQDEGVFLRLLHERIVREDGRKGVGQGWSGSFENLERFVGG